MGLLLAIVRYFWIVKEDRSKDNSVFIPLATFLVIFFTSNKFLTFHMTPLYFLCRQGRDIKNLDELDNIIVLGEEWMHNTTTWKMELGTFMKIERKISLTFLK